MIITQETKANNIYDHMIITNPIWMLPTLPIFLSFVGWSYDYNNTF
jgi:hypothetical protein